MVLGTLRGLLTITQTPVTTALPRRHSNSHMRRNQETEIYFPWVLFRRTLLYTAANSHTWKGGKREGAHPFFFFRSLPLQCRRGTEKGGGERRRRRRRGRREVRRRGRFLDAWSFWKRREEGWTPAGSLHAHMPH